MKYLLIPIIVLLLVPAVNVFAKSTNPSSDTNTNSNSVTSTQSTSINGQGTVTTSSSHDGGPMVTHTHEFHGTGIQHGFFPFFHHPHVVIVHEHTSTSPHVVIVHRSSSGSNNQNIPIVFVKGVGFVAPIGCKLNSAGDKIVCDFEQVQIN